MPTDNTLIEIFPMDLGSFYLTDKMGVRLSDVTVQNIFNAPMWKSYYISKAGRFVHYDCRSGHRGECKIVRC